MNGPVTMDAWQFFALIAVSLTLFLIGVFYYIREIIISAHVEADRRIREERRR